MSEVKGKDNFAVTPTVGGTIVSLEGHDHDHDALTNFVANDHIDHSTLTLTAGIGLSGGGVLTESRTLNLDITGLTADASPDGAADYVVTYDASATAHKKVLLDNLPGGGGGSASFTEAWTNLGRPSSASTWQTKTVTGASANSIIKVVLTNNINNASAVMGVREVGSSIQRSITIGKGGTPMTVTVNTNSSSQIEWYSDTTNVDVTFYFSGELA